MAFVWTMLAMYLIELFYGESKKVFRDPLPMGAAWVMDIICISMLIHADWYVIATAYTMSAIALEMVYRRGRGKS
jgi:hypothetical protein